MNTIPKLLACLFFLLPSLSVHAQVSAGGTPLSFTPSFLQRYGPADVPALTVASLDVQRALTDESRRPGSRFTEPLAVDLSPASAGEWLRLPNGDGLWRLRIRAPGALALAFLYDQFELPAGATLFMYSADRRQVLGAYTSRNNRPAGKFMTGLIRGESAVLEYYEPRAVAGQGRLHLFRIDRAYRDEYQERDLPGVRTHSGQSLPGFGTSQTCNQNVNCPVGESWRKQQRAVCRILVVVEEGIGLCSGTLVNNTRQDGAPYVLSGFHCQDSYTPLYDFWRFDFNYESPTCENPAQEPFFQSVLGCRPLAGRQENDMLLLEITSTIPPSYKVYFAGWNRQTAPPASAVAIHHPVGDIKKISTIAGGILIFNGSIDWNNNVRTPAGHHYTMNFTTGTFEVGSSGSALFDPAGLVVGTLHGGNPSCAQTQAYYARLALAWEGGGAPATRLRDWLDPTGSGVTQLAGREQPAVATGAISGVVRTETGAPIAGVTVVLTNLPTRGALTDTQGRFTLDGLPLNEVYGLTLSRDGDDINGLSALDLVRLRKHVLGLEPLGSPYRILAADVNLSGSLTALDAIKISKVILGVTPAFEEVESWTFLPAAYTFSNPDDPFADALPAVIFIADFTENLTGIDFIGIKYGDTNNSAETGVWK